MKGFFQKRLLDIFAVLIVYLRNLLKSFRSILTNELFASFITKKKESSLSFNSDLTHMSGESV